MEMCVMVRKGKGVRHFQTEYPLTDGGGLIISIIRACPLLSPWPNTLFSQSKHDQRCNFGHSKLQESSYSENLKSALPLKSAPTEMWLLIL